MNRREFIAATATILLAAAEKSPAEMTSRAVERIMTVNGPVEALALGTALPHEHVLVDFIGADGALPDRYDGDEVVRVVLPQFERSARLGCRTLVECTPAGLGRDPNLLTRLSKASGLHLITNTGYYGAGSDFKYLPAHAQTETAEHWPADGCASSSTASAIWGCGRGSSRLA